MFPGCTLTDMRARQADLLREGGYEPTRRWMPPSWSDGLALVHPLIRVMVSLLAALGL